MKPRSSTSRTPRGAPTLDDLDERTRQLDALLAGAPSAAAPASFSFLGAAPPVGRTGSSAAYDRSEGRRSLGTGASAAASQQFKAPRRTSAYAHGPAAAPAYDAGLFPASTYASESGAYAPGFGPASTYTSGHATAAGPAYASGYAASAPGFGPTSTYASESGAYAPGYGPHSTYASESGAYAPGYGPHSTYDSGDAAGPTYASGFGAGAGSASASGHAAGPTHASGSGADSAPGGASLAHYYNNIFVSYGHSHITPSTSSNYKVNVPHGICIVNIVEPGKYAYAAHQEQFFNACHEAQGDAERTRWFQNPIKHKSQLETFLNTRAHTCKTPPIPITLSFSIGDRNQKCTNFELHSLTDDTTGTNGGTQVGQYTMYKSGVHAFNTAGSGTYKIDSIASKKDDIDKQVKLYMKPGVVQKTYKGSVLPTIADLKPLAPGLKALNPTVITKIDELFAFLLTQPGTSIFYNAACRSIDENVPAAEAASLEPLLTKMSNDRTGQFAHELGRGKSFTPYNPRQGALLAASVKAPLTSVAEETYTLSANEVKALDLQINGKSKSEIAAMGYPVYHLSNTLKKKRRANNRSRKNRK